MTEVSTCVPVGTTATANWTFAVWLLGQFLLFQNYLEGEARTCVPEIPVLLVFSPKHCILSPAKGSTQDRGYCISLFTQANAGTALSESCVHSYFFLHISARLYLTCSQPSFPLIYLKFTSTVWNYLFRSVLWETLPSLHEKTWEKCLLFLRSFLTVCLSGSQKEWRYTC